MPSPFPGMNPYLEQPTFWSSFHSRLIVAIADTLAPILRPYYYIEVESRTYLSDTSEEIAIGIPDGVVLSANASSSSSQGVRSTLSGAIVQAPPQRITLPMPVEVKERYLEVREVGTDAVITVIEVLSPKNKRSGEGRLIYERKRQAILGSLSHFVEIDLLRSGLAMAMSGEVVGKAYRIVVSRSQQRPVADLYEFSLQEAIPTFLLPLKDDEFVNVNLQEIIEGVFDRASYDLRLDYRQPLPPPALSVNDQAWVERLLKNFRANEH
jgi:hypothetical protein